MFPKKQISYQFLKYIKPIWYFNLRPDQINKFWEFPEDYLKVNEPNLETETKYSDKCISDWDISFQRISMGSITEIIGLSSLEFEKKINPNDLYHFIKKYFKNKWIVIVFIQRILTFNNPLSDLIAIWNSRNTRKINLYNQEYEYVSYPSFTSKLISDLPLVSIIIPTFNRYNVLASLLADLEKQNYSNFEVLIIDQSWDFNKEFYKRYKYKINIIRQKTPALWRARNKGIETANSDLLLFLDDDSRLRPDWIFEHLKCIDYFKADISSGISKSKIGAKIPENYSYFRLSDQLDTGNVLIKKEVFIKCGLFDEKFEKMRMGDGEFGVRAYLNGFINISNPFAFRDHLKIKNGGLRYWGHWDAYRSKNILAPRPIPSVLYLYRKYWGNDAALFQLLQSIPFSYTPYRLKSRMWGYILSLCIFFLFFPIVILQTISSWRTSSKMLNGNSQIKKL